MEETTLKVGVCSGCARRKFCVEHQAGDEQVRICPRCQRARELGDGLAGASPSLYDACLQLLLDLEVQTLKSGGVSFLARGPRVETVMAIRDAVRSAGGTR